MVLASEASHAYEEAIAEQPEQPPNDQPKRRGRPPSNDPRALSIPESLKQAFHALGGVEALVAWGRSRPTDFYRLTGKLIPQEIKAALDVHERVIYHAIPPSALDHHPGSPAPHVEVLQEDPPPIHLLSTDDADREKGER